ncbi:MAG: YebC/PmpR family DNA-binding transcriptional regulator [Candidatus Eisenbacteria bacterium]|uniref:Probable transcriptional regulatory protein KDA27_02780 n=1 Tax=Eiseniibacteriota bacterium TaxID=2212470 RepID=A0A956SBV9_UNCEI|nr:YebC/PmpR family DNA-binding transcriptional regulator [Candidatus Eisenbacteria bacterium]MCB9464902.1 YebC/PmpR family DNA-binding transcriptional regulator [Candidatus Eisenbacteria bacterium]
MSGHSKWSTIKRKKAKIDAERGKAFTKVIKEITIAARAGGGDPESNPRLRTAVLAAKAVNMPADNVKKAIQKGTGELEGVNYEEITYEGYAPHGVAVFLECTTDNKNRTAPEIRHLFSKYGGNMAENGAVSWVFERKGLITVAREGVDEDAIMEAALEAGAEDVKMEEDDVYEIYTEPSELHTVLDGMEGKGLDIQGAELIRIPTNTVTLDERQAESVLKIIDLFEEHDDVNKVWSNFDIPAEVMEKLGA